MEKTLSCLLFLKGNTVKSLISGFIKLPVQRDCDCAVSQRSRLSVGEKKYKKIKNNSTCEKSEFFFQTEYYSCISFFFPPSFFSFSEKKKKTKKKKKKTTMRVFVLATIACAAVAHDGLPKNPNLNVPGYPDCVQTENDGDEFTLECHQNKETPSQITIGCVGDSITAGVHSTGGNHTYPGQLQIMLGDDYNVTNLGACGSTLLKSGDSPYWDRPQYDTLTNNTWDIIIIMLGTNDAKDNSSGGPPNWPRNCTQRSLRCPFAEDYHSMIKVVRKLGNPKIYTMIPPPLMKQGIYGMNQTVINDILPVLIPKINEKNGLPHLSIDIFDALGGADKSSFPKGGCTLNDSKIADCSSFCDKQSCDQCHPNNNGYKRLAAAVKKGLGL